MKQTTTHRTALVTVASRGLGLALAKRYMDMNGGQIEVDSRPGSGCTFRVVLPRNRD